MSVDRDLELYKERSFNIFMNAWSTRSSVDITAYQFSMHFKLLHPQGKVLECLKLNLSALHQCATVEPTSIDFLLRVYARFCKNLDGISLESELTGRYIGQMLLLDWLKESPSCSKVYFFSKIQEAARVGPDLGDVILRLEQTQWKRREFIVSTAILGRCHALGILRGGVPGNMLRALIADALETHSKWKQNSQDSKVGTEATFVGFCMMMRGCGLTVMEDVSSGAAQLDKWKNTLETFIRAENNFGHYCHASLAFRNVEDGPWDETSEELFDSVRWIF